MRSYKGKKIIFALISRTEELGKAYGYVCEKEEVIVEIYKRSMAVQEVIRYVMCPT